MERFVGNRHAQEEKDGMRTTLNYLALQKLLKCSIESSCKNYIKGQKYLWCFVEDGTNKHINVSAEDIHKWVDEIGLNRATTAVPPQSLRNKWNDANRRQQEAREGPGIPGSHPEWNPSLSGRRPRASYVPQLTQIVVNVNANHNSNNAGEARWLGNLAMPSNHAPSYPQSFAPPSSYHGSQYEPQLPSVAGPPSYSNRSSLRPTQYGIPIRSSSPPAPPADLDPRGVISQLCHQFYPDGTQARRGRSWS